MTWAGDWQVSWPDGVGSVQLLQQGTTVQGTYRKGRGRIEAQADGSEIKGEILLDPATVRFSATLSTDGMSFSGHTDAGGWLSGLRLSAEDVDGGKLSLDLQNPRATMSSFLKAGNRARTGDTDALALAADAIDPGDGGIWPSEQARIEGARTLFNTVDLATFNLTSIPNSVAGASKKVSLPRLDSKLTVDLDFVRGSDGNWRILMPSAANLSAMNQTSSPSTADGFRLLQSPRDTMRSFLDGMLHWEKGGEAEALATLDLSNVADVLKAAEGRIAASYLARIIDRVGFMPLQSLPNSGISREPFVFFSHPDGQIVIAPYGAGADTRWRFSADTVQGLRRLYRAVEELPDIHLLDSSLIPYSEALTVRDFIKARAPALLRNFLGSNHVEYWQVIGAVTIAVMTLLMATILSRIMQFILGRFSFGRYVSRPDWMAWTVGLGVAFLIGTQSLEHIGLTTARWPYFASTLGTVVLLVLSYAAWSLIHALSSLLQTYAARSDTPLDNIMLTFGTGVIRLLLLGGAGLLLGAMWSLPTTGLLAGLGIGGLAIAFASKETLANVFGAGILLADRPFQTGDRIIAGDINGWVEAVNLRSTRIRMLDDSMIIVPNGKLADMPIINRGAKRRQVFAATLLVTSGGSREKLEALTEDIRGRLLADPIFDAHDMEVNVAEVDRHGIKVEIFTGVNTLQGREYRKAAHLLLLDIMSMAKVRDVTLGRGTEIHPRSELEEA